MRALTRLLQRHGRRLLARADAVGNALYTWRYNPLYHTGALVVVCFGALLATGLYLLLFYRIGSPYASVARITDQAWTGRWIRTLHRYISDLAILAVAVHAFRMFVQDRAWGPRALAWISGVILVLVFFVCGWTGYVMVWDVQAQLFAVEGARLFDAFPIFSEPIGRAFVGERPIPSAFFFLNLFAHIAVPVGIIFILWIHLSRLARTNLLPPKALTWGTIGLFTGLSVVLPAAMGPEADPLRVPGEVPLDLFYGFWLPLTRQIPAGSAWIALLLGCAAALAVPLLTRPESREAVAPSYVNPRFCTGCEQCYHDCPYEAISMVPRTDGRDGYVATVSPDKCVSCGICAGSCAPMGVGPPGRTGRDQLEEVKALLARTRLAAEEVVVVGCRRSAAGWDTEDVDGAPVLPVPCAGAMHTSVIEYLVRAGAGGVLVVACPPRDCWNREGVTWFEERVFEGREAELQERVDRRRVRVVYAAEGEQRALRGAVASYRDALGGFEAAEAESGISIDTVCEAPTVSVAEELGS